MFYVATMSHGCGGRLYRGRQGRVARQVSRRPLYQCRLPVHTSTPSLGVDASKMYSI